MPIQSISSVKTIKRLFQNPSAGPRIAFITGGTGSRELALHIKEFTHNTSYIIGTADSGGSTRQLRLLFDMPAIGDFRSRLVDLADTKAPGHRETTELLRYRLPKEATPGELEGELHSIIIGDHQLARAIQSNREAAWFSTVIRKSLEEFQNARTSSESELGQRFDLAGASIGNLFLSGYYLYYYRDLTAAINTYKLLAGVKGDIIPATLEAVHIAALMADGKKVFGQHLMTAYKNGPVEDMWYVESEEEGSRKTDPQLNPLVNDALLNANLIVFSMGSFWSSILSVLRIAGLAKAVRKSKAEKVLIINSAQDEETVGMTAGDMAGKVISTMTQSDTNAVPDSSYVSHVLVNNRFDPDVTFQSKYGQTFGLVSPEIRLADPNIDITRADLLKTEKNYDPEILTRYLFQILIRKHANEGSFDEFGE